MFFLRTISSKDFEFKSGRKNGGFRIFARKLAKIGLFQCLKKSILGQNLDFWHENSTFFIA